MRVKVSGYRNAATIMLAQLLNYELQFPNSPLFGTCSSDTLLVHLFTQLLTHNSSVRKKPLM
jgi:hypothetical protein